MIESNKICEILEGIDQDETYNACGWWETSFGATFGKERLKELLDYIELEKNDIGLKDINGKSIYADCSIVEFEHKYRTRTRTFNGFLNSQSFAKEQCELLQGFFTWNSDKLRYEIDILNHDFFICLDFVSTMKNFKIIDTIQENRLGLIK